MLTVLQSLRLPIHACIYPIYPNIPTIRNPSISCHELAIQLVTLTAHNTTTLLKVSPGLVVVLLLVVRYRIHTLVHLVKDELVRIGLVSEDI